MAQIAVLHETELEPNADGSWRAAGAEAPQPLVSPSPAPTPAAAPHVSRETEIVGALQILNGRLQAVERTVADVPKAASLLRALLGALGTQSLMCLSMLGCMALAIPLALHPTWEGAAILGAFSVIIYLPLAALALWGKRP